MNSFLITQAEAEAGLANDGMSLDDYDDTILGLVWDGVDWQVLEDSLLDEAEAMEWANRAAKYGEHVGLYVWKRP